MSNRKFVAALIALQSVLLLFHIDKQSLWLDEVMSLDAVHRLASFFSQFPEQQPLYYILLKPWMLLNGGDAWLRLLSAVFAIACTPLFFILARRLTGERIARIAVALFVFSPFFVYYGQEGRMYTLLTLMAIASTLSFVTWQQDRRRAALFAYVACSILGMYTHFFFIFLLFAHLVAAIFTERPRRLSAIRETVLANVVVGVAYLPWAAFMLRHGAGGRGQPWKGSEHVILSVPYTLMRFAVGYAELLANAGWKTHQLSMIRQDIGVLAPAAIVVGVLIVAGIQELRQRSWPGKATLACLAAPAGASLLASVAVILLGERYWIISFPFFLLTMAAGLEWMFTRAPRWAAASVALLYLGVTVKSLGDYYARAEFGKEQWREAAAYVVAHRSAGEDVIVSPREVYLPFEYYFQRHGAGTVQYATPESLSTLGSPQFWLVTSYLPDPEGLASGLGSSFRLEERKFFPKETGIWVFRFTAPASTGSAVGQRRVAGGSY